MALSLISKAPSWGFLLLAKPHGRGPAIPFLIAQAVEVHKRKFTHQLPQHARVSTQDLDNAAQLTTLGALTVEIKLGRVLQAQHHRVLCHARA